MNVKIGFPAGSQQSQSCMEASSLTDIEFFFNKQALFSKMEEEMDADMRGTGYVNQPTIRFLMDKLNSIFGWMFPYTITNMEEVLEDYMTVYSGKEELINWEDSLQLTYNEKSYSKT